MTRSEAQDSDRDEIAEFIERHWHSRVVMSRGRAFQPHHEGAILERAEGRIVGLLTYHIDHEGMEILTLNSTLEGRRIGSSLMLDAIETARKRGCRRIFLTTTNVNLRAIGFYQRLGFRMVAINVGVVDEARKTKPEIPETDERGIPIRDEILMELEVEPYLDG